MAVEYSYNGERCYVTAEARGSRLPVRHRGGVVLMHLWGAQGRAFYNEPASIRIRWPDDPFVDLALIKGGAWAEFEPKAVRIPITRFMVYRTPGEVTIDQWFKLTPGEYLQGALLKRGVEDAVYVVTVPPPPELDVVSSWPRIVKSSTTASSVRGNKGDPR